MLPMIRNGGNGRVQSGFAPPAGCCTELMPANDNRRTSLWSMRPRCSVYSSRSSRRRRVLFERLGSPPSAAALLEEVLHQRAAFLLADAADDVEAMIVAGQFAAAHGGRD